MNIMRISINNIHIFRALTSRPNIIYSVIEYMENKFKREDIIVIYRLIEQKLEKYTILAKIIIYNNSIITIQEVNSILDCYTYYRDMSNIIIKDEIRKV
jgi:hypothetical protein